jgi:hypothetical protein
VVNGSEMNSLLKLLKGVVKYTRLNKSSK